MVLNSKRWPFLIAVAVAATAFMIVEDTMAYEEPPYTILEQSDLFELRDYEPYLITEVQVRGRFEDVGNEAFKVLFDYISGNNVKEQKIAMTIPVTQQPNASSGERISMTTPVLQSPEAEGDDGYRFSFIMPTVYTLKTLPKPVDRRIQIRALPGRLMAARRYSGTWSEDNYRKNETILKDAIKEQGLKAEGDPIYARYNSPFSLWFLRRNEVLVEVAR